MTDLAPHLAPTSPRVALQATSPTSPPPYGGEVANHLAPQVAPTPEKDTPMNTTRHALYRFYNTAGQLLYIGITLNPGARWKSHSKTKPWWHDVAEMKVEQYPDRPSVLDAEAQAIASEHPAHNVMHNRGGRPVHQVEPVVTADEMPDDCHDRCVTQGLDSIYHPYRWVSGKAFYACDLGHRWACWWGHEQTGEEPDNWGKRFDTNNLPDTTGRRRVYASCGVLA